MKDIGNWNTNHWYISGRGISLLGQLKKKKKVSSVKDTAALYVFTAFIAPPSWLVLHNNCTPLKHRVIQPGSSLKYISVESNHHAKCKIFLFLYFMEKSQSMYDLWKDIDDFWITSVTLRQQWDTGLVICVPFWSVF